MSEYQYYEFQAVDRPLTGKEMDALRSYSSRARITPTSFVNEYSFGNFKGDEDKWMERYFDAFLYVANWGSHLLKLRIPSKFLPLATAKQYCGGDSVYAKEKDERIVLTFDSESEDGGDWEEEEGESWLASLIPIRAELARGDLRALYIGWLLRAQNGELDAEAVEPVVPPNLSRLSASLQSLAEFLRIDEELLAVAAEGSVETEDQIDRTMLLAWVAGLAPATKDELILRLMLDGEAQLQNELLARFNQEHRKSAKGDARQQRRRTAAELLAAAEERAEICRQAEAKEAAEEKARRSREAALARERYLDDLAGREAKVWSEIDQLIATKSPKNYDKAVQLLKDLRELSLRKKTEAGFGSRIEGLHATHALKPSFLKRLQAAGL